MKIVLFHGYGANGADLAPLEHEIHSKKKFDWSFPDAPIDLGGGLAWFHIDVDKINEAQMTGKAVDFSASNPDDIKDAREEGFRVVKSLGVPWSEVIVGGFSQGAMLATDLALRAPEPPAGLIILSGNLINEKAWKELTPKRKGLPFFQSHGIADPILGHKGALRLHELLSGAGLKGKLLSFEGGHSITPEVLDGLARYLDAV